MLKIWGRVNSVNVKKAMWCVAELGLPHERIDAGMQYGVVNTPEYRKMNPNGLVPVIEDGGAIIWESNAIVRYLCARHGMGTLCPPELQRRADMERWMDWQQTTLNPAGRPAFMQWIRTPADRRDPHVIAESVAATEPLMALLDQHLARQPFIAGDRLTMADLPIACEVHRWIRLPQPRTERTHLDRWYAAILARPSSRGVLDIALT